MCKKSKSPPFLYYKKVQKVKNEKVLNLLGPDSALAHTLSLVEVPPQQDAEHGLQLVQLVQAPGGSILKKD